MQEGGFYQANRISPARLGVVIGVHAAAIAALALAKMEVIPDLDFGRTEVTFVDPAVVPPPPPPPQTKVEPKTRSESRVDTPDPRIITPNESRYQVTQEPIDEVIFDPGAIGDDKPQPRIEVVPPPPPPPPLPVRTEARLKSGDLQPPYPASEERLGNEGKVVVRVTVGADGRVKEVERVEATSDAFFRSTERHALRAWRFEPASVDGKPVESRKTMSLTFRLDD